MILRPTFKVRGDLTDLDPAVLSAAGIKGLILDLDSTLMEPRAGVLTTGTKHWLEEATKHFKIAVVSNNHKTDYLDGVRTHLNGFVVIPVIGSARKPSRKALFAAAQILELAPELVAVVGDRPLTDVLGGMRSGMSTVLVYPLKTIIEPKWKTMIRRLERVVIFPW